MTDNAEAVAASIRDAGGTAIAAGFDIADDDSVAGLVATAVREYGGLDRMHANAADLSEAVIMQDSDAVGVDLGVFDRTIEVNLRGFLLCTRHSIPAMLERGDGVIVYTSSAASYVGEPERPSYAVSKSGINALMRHVSTRWGREGIRANCVAPGLVLTKTIRDAIDGEFLAMALGVGRSPRLGEAEDIAAAVAFLFSDDATWITGQVISVDGGSTIRA